MAYDFNDDAEAIATELITKYHRHLADVKIAYLFKGEEEDKVPQPAKEGKAVQYAKCALVPEKYQLLAKEDYRFVIEFSQPIWIRLPHDHRVALVDHELCHAKFDKGTGEAWVADHSVEEFREILVRHGFWRQSIRLFVEAAQPLFDQPGIQMQFTTPLARTPAVAYGEPIRIVETGEIWVFDKETGWIKTCIEVDPTMVTTEAVKAN